MVMSRSYRNIKPTMGELASLRGSWRRHPLYKGCIGDWLFCDGGLAVGDISGYLRDASITGSVEWGMSASGRVLDFNGGHLSGQFIDLSGLSEVSISAWVYPDGTGSLYAIAGNWGTAASTARVMIRIAVGGNLQGYVETTGGQLGGSFTDLTVIPGAWNHIVFTYSAASNLNGYLNGIASGTPFSATGSLPGTPSDKTFDIGWDARATNAYFGLISGVMLYSRELTREDVYRLYTEPFTHFRWAASNQIAGNQFFTTQEAQSAIGAVLNYLYR